MTTSEKNKQRHCHLRPSREWLDSNYNAPVACRGFVNLSNDGCLQSIFLKDGTRNDTKWYHNPKEGWGLSLSLPHWVCPGEKITKHVSFFCFVAPGGVKCQGVPTCCPYCCGWLSPSLLTGSPRYQLSTKSSQRMFSWAMKKIPLSWLACKLVV